MTVATQRRPRELVLDALRIENGMRQLLNDLLELGDDRGAEITKILLDQWRARTKAIERDTCDACGGFKGKCTADARCTCARTANRLPEEKPIA